MAGVRRMAAFTALARAFWQARKPGEPGIAARLRAVPRMVRLGLSGRYPFLDRTRLGLVVLGLVYVLSPVDLVPELFVPLLGLGDDAVVLAWLAGAVLAEADAFLTWEREREHSQSRVVVGEVVDG